MEIKTLDLIAPPGVKTGESESSTKEITRYTMSFNSKFISISVLALAVSGFSTIASAQETTTTQKENTVQRVEKRERVGFGGRREGGPRGMMRMLRGIELTDAQKTQVKTIMESNKPDQSTMDEMRTLFTAKRDGTITTEQQERLQTLKQQGREKAEAIHSQILAVLTSEQRQQLEQRKQEMRQRMKERRQSGDQNKPIPDKPTANR